MPETITSSSKPDAAPPPSVKITAPSHQPVIDADAPTPGTIADFLKSIEGATTDDSAPDLTPATHQNVIVPPEESHQVDPKPLTPPDESVPPTGRGSHKRWDELKAKEKKLAEIEKLHAESEKERAELKKWREEREKLQIVDPDEFTRIKKEREDLAAEMKVLDITRDPEFQQQILNPMAEAILAAEAAVPEEFRGEVRQALMETSRLERSKRLHAVKEKAELQEWQVDALKEAGRDAFPLVQRYRSAIANAGELAKKRELDIGNRAKAEKDKITKTIVEKLESAASDPALSQMFKAENDDQKPTVSARLKRIHSYFESPADPDTMAKGAIWSAIGPDLQAENAALKKQLAEIQAKKDKGREIADLTPNGSSTARSSDGDENDFDMSAAAIERRLLRASSR